MKALLITDKGLEFSCKKEIMSKLGVDVKVEGRIARFDSDIHGLARLVYTAQSCIRVLAEISCFDYEDLEEDCFSAVKDFEWKDWLEEGMSFRVRCDRFGNHSFSSNDAERMIGTAVFESIEKFGLSPEVDLENPDLMIHCVIQGSRVCMGIDLAGRDLSRREYKIYSHPTTIRGNLAHSLVSLSDFENGLTFIDPFCGSAPIPIEAVFHATNIPIRSQSRNFAFTSLKPFREEDWESFFTKINKECSVDGVKVIASDRSSRNLKYGKDNAKIGGVRDLIDFKVMDVEWLDTKFEKRSIDAIVTQPSQDTKNADSSDVEKSYDELFYQANYVLSESGCIVALLLKTEKFRNFCEKHGFEVVDEKKVVIGNLKYHILKCKAKA